MAQKTLSFKRNGHVLGVFCLLLITLVHRADGFQFRVGGSGATWGVPSDSNASFYNQWAENSRFQIGDSLLFVYGAGQDAVLEVNRNDYDNCNTAAPITRLTDGHSVFQFNRSGPYYFISGSADNCRTNEKMVVVVLADRSRSGGAAPPPAPVAVPPPSPAPTSPPPPPAEVHPAPAPAPSLHHHNAASSSTVVGIGGVLGILVASSLI